MWKPEEMLFFQFFLLKRDVTAVITQLARLGVVHLSRSLGIKEGEPFKPLNVNDESLRMRGLMKRVSRLIDILSIDPGEGKETPRLFDVNAVLEQASSVIERVEGEVLSIADSLRDIEEMRHENELLTSSIERLRILDVELEKLLNFKFFYVVIGRIPTEKIDRLEESLKDIPHIILPYERDGSKTLLLTATVLDKAETLKNALKSAYFIELQIPEEVGGLPDNALRILARREEELDNKIRSLREALEEAKAKWGAELIRVYMELSNCEQIFLWEQEFSSTGRLVPISGYVPKSAEKDVREAVRSVVGERVLMEFRAPSKGDPAPPTVLKNPRFLKPFEGLVTTYGYPEYGHIDPSLFFAISYLLMFGSMFGDVGQGLLLLVGGILVNSGRLKLLRQFQSLGPFLVGVGLSSSLFGLLYGSFFGRDDLIPALWLRPMENVESFIIVGIFFGFVMISSGILIRILDLLHDGDHFALFFDEYGFFSALMYWCAVGGAVLLLLNRSSAGYLLLIASGLFLLLKIIAPLFIGGRLGREGVDPLETLFGGLEAILSYFTNSLSFARLSAFTLAHGALGVAIYQVAEMVSALPMGLLYAVLVIAGGNLFVIALEGLIVGIQALRLEFYEFFSKFFSGDGIRYEPMKFRY